MTQGNPSKILFAFAIPMVLGNIFQQLYNITDSVIVGNFVGADALAAVGASSSVTFLFIALATGASMGANVVISQLFGAKAYGRMKGAIFTALIAVAGLSVFLMLVGLVFNENILLFMRTPANIMADASQYLRIYFLGLIFLFLYNLFNGIFNALGDSKTPLYFLIFSSLLNIGLDILFVTAFHMGVAGVAWATFLAQLTACTLCAGVLTVKMKRLRIEEPFVYFDYPTLLSVCNIAIPSSIQQSIVSIGMLLVQTLINGYGSTVVAGYTAATKIDSIAIMPMVNVGSALSTFVAQNMGAKKAQRISEGFKAALKLSMSIALIISCGCFLFAGELVGLFLDTAANQEVIQVGVAYIRVVSAFYFIFGLMNLSNGVLRGAGDMRLFMSATLCNLATRVILAYGGAWLLGSVSAVWWAIPIGWLGGMTIATLRYRSGKWKRDII